MYLGTYVFIYNDLRHLLVSCMSEGDTHLNGDEQGT